MGRFRKGAPTFLVMASKQAIKTSKGRKGEAEKTVEPPAEPKSRKELISTLISRVQQQLDAETAKVTLADFIRLIQLQRELEKDEQPAEVIVTWRDVSETQNTV